jgi:thiamine kinase-like enzyme
MLQRHGHQPEVQAFLQKTFGERAWAFTQPAGTGNETYFAASTDRRCFVKVGAVIDRAVAMAAAGLSPPVWATGQLADGASILVQPYVNGRRPRPRDFQEHLEPVATMVRRMHEDVGVWQTLPPVASADYRTTGLQVLARLWQRWDHYRAQVPAVAAFVDAGLAQLNVQIAQFYGAGLVAAHNDICNANWLLTPAGHWYLIDLETMSWEDPAVDLGALLWWYYPPAQRARFLAVAGHADDAALRQRMQARMALHCLTITLPRAGSFDRFDPTTFSDALADFRAALGGAENPQGYGG